VFLLYYILKLTCGKIVTVTGNTLLPKRLADHFLSLSDGRWNLFFFMQYPKTPPFLQDKCEEAPVPFRSKTCHQNFQLCMHNGSLCYLSKFRGCLVRRFAPSDTGWILMHAEPEWFLRLPCGCYLNGIAWWRMEWTKDANQTPIVGAELDSNCTANQTRCYRPIMWCKLGQKHIQLSPDDGLYG
jgi:hypothetical protein